MKMFDGINTPEMVRHAIEIATNHHVLAADAKKSKSKPYEEMYKCPECNKVVVLRKGKILKPYFAHKPNSDCCYYTNESPIHYESKEMLKNVLSEYDCTVTIKRKCTECKDMFEYRMDLFDGDGIKTVSEWPFKYNGINRKADIACIYNTQNHETIILCILEICNTNPTKCEKRPEPWFELNAKDVYDTLISFHNAQEALKSPNEDKKCEFTFTCIRDTYCEEMKHYGMCDECEKGWKEKDPPSDLPSPGIVYFNQRGAGCGKTYESIQLLMSPEFEEKSTFIYLTKMHSAVEVIYKEWEDQYDRKLFKGMEAKVEKLEKHYKIKLSKKMEEGTTIKTVNVIIGTVDSFNYAICKNKDLRGNDAFRQLVKYIIDKHMEIKENGEIYFARANPKLNQECLLIIDEAQDLDDDHQKMVNTIIDRTQMDAYIIGDKLQSILNEKNCHTKWDGAKSSPCLVKSYGENIVRRFHNTQFIEFVNNVVQFGKYGLDPIKNICDGTTCGYEHENECNPIHLDDGFDNIYTIDDARVLECVDSVLEDMSWKIKKHGYLPNNFCFIFPVVNHNNKILSMLYPALETFWVEFFAKAESYNIPLLLENMEKCRNVWETKLKLREKDDSIQKYVVWHRSEGNRPINMKESENQSRIISIHSSKGTGCECVYLLGVSEMTLGCFCGGRKDNLMYESFLHVGLTRQKKYLYVGYDGKSGDDICRRFSKVNANRIQNKNTPPYVADITSITRLKNICTEGTTNELIKKQLEGILDLSDKTIHEKYLGDEKVENRNIVDWGHHIIRYCVLRANIDIYLYRHVDQTGQHLYAKWKNITDAKYEQFVFQEWKKQVNKLQCTISHNINTKSEKKLLVVPILMLTTDTFGKFQSYIWDTVHYTIDKLHKLQSSSGKSIVFCPIETMIYVYLMEMIQHPTRCGVSIIDIYHILYDYHDGLDDVQEHNETYGCICSKYCVRKQTNSFTLSNQEIENSIVHHYAAIERVQTIMKHYETSVQECFGSFVANNMKYNIDKSIVKGGTNGDLSIQTRVDYYGETPGTKNKVHLYLAPKLSKLNIYDILTQIYYTQFLMKETEEVNEEGGYDDAPTIQCYIITLDSDRPIQVDFTKTSLSKAKDTKDVLKDILYNHYAGYHSRIYYFLEHFRMDHRTSYLTSVLDKLGEDNDKNYKSKGKKFKNFPNYIIKWIENHDENWKENEGKSNVYEDLGYENETHLYEDLGKKLDYALKRLLR